MTFDSGWEHPWETIRRDDSDTYPNYVAAIVDAVFAPVIGLAAAVVLAEAHTGLARAGTAAVVAAESNSADDSLCVAAPVGSVAVTAVETVAGCASRSTWVDADHQ